VEHQLQIKAVQNSVRNIDVLGVEDPSKSMNVCFFLLIYVFVVAFNEYSS
jgi:hypothetical protein